jgi:uncharacterized protein YndB with AHSA1/START domain
MAATESLGTFERRGEHIDVRFVRHYPRPVEKVWSALTDPARLADWMGASHVEPFVGGRFDLMTDNEHGSTGRVRVWDPPRVLEFSWSNTHSTDSVVRCELTPEAGGTRLVFIHQGMPYATSALMLPGWHGYLAALASVVMDERPPEGISFRTMQSTYIGHYKMEGVQLDP